VWTESLLVFWLMPAADAQIVFSGMINELAARFDAPAFEPHVTICGADVAEVEATKILREVPAREPIALEVSGVEFSEKYTKSLFVQFRPSPELRSLAAELQNPLGSADELNPHLSLLYKEMPLARKADAARTVTLPFRSVTFDCVQTIVAPAAITRREEVEAWRTVAQRRLDRIAT
jgi:putative hydrolase of the HAD superfamily